MTDHTPISRVGARPIDQNNDLRIALACLSHPAALLAAAFLLLNDQVLQPAAPSWWTGKLGGLAWLVIAPLLAGATLSLLPRNWRANRRWVGAAAILLTGLAFALAKTTPAVNAAVVSLFGLAGVAAKLALDPWDLLALPALWLAWRIWNSPPRLRLPVPARLAGAALVALALAADSAGAINLGVACVGQSGPVIFAVTSTTPSGYFGKYTETVLHSTDGGLTWVVNDVLELNSDQAPNANQARCAQNVWPLDTGSAEYVWVEGSGLYRTTDSGQTLALDKPASEWPTQAQSAIYDAASGNLVVAAGVNGVLVRSAGDGWQTVALPLGPGR